MTTEEALEIFTSLDKESRLLFLARYGHQLTIIARSAYVEEVSDMLAMRLLRDLNEIEHRLFGYMASIMTNDAHCFDDRTIVSILLGNEPAGSGTATAFEAALRRTQ
jgi:hypothetical protein